MKIKLHGLPKRSSELSETIDPNTLGLPPDSFKAPIEVKLRLEDVGELINADFEIYTVSEQSCCRCLADFIIDLNLKGRLIFMPAFDKGYSDSDDVLLFDPARPEVDISQNLLDELMLAIPYKPLCKEDCKGLCPNCGVNLNETKCDCVIEKIDPRWAALSDLRDKLADHESD